MKIRWSIILSALFGTVFGGVSVGLATGLVGDLRQFQVQEVHAQLAVDGSNERRLAGFADNVFRGRVVAKQGQAAHSTTDVPLTLWTVDVLSNFKGNLEGTVTVSQFGGYEPFSNTLKLMEDDALLSVGSEYVLAAKFDAQNNRYFITPKFGDIKIPDGSAKSLTAVDNHWKDVVANEIPFEGPR